MRHRVPDADQFQLQRRSVQRAVPCDQRVQAGACRGEEKQGVCDGDKVSLIQTLTEPP